jgi:hypothetical protein
VENNSNNPHPSLYNKKLHLQLFLKQLVAHLLVEALLQAVEDPHQVLKLSKLTPHQHTLELLVSQKEEDVSLHHLQRKALEVKQILRQQPQHRQPNSIPGVVLLKQNLLDLNLYLNLLCRWEVTLQLANLPVVVVAKSMQECRLLNSWLRMLLD